MGRSPRGFGAAPECQVQSSNFPRVLPTVPKFGGRGLVALDQGFAVECGSLSPPIIDPTLSQALPGDPWKRPQFKDLGVSGCFAGSRYVSTRDRYQSWYRHRNFGRYHEIDGQPGAQRQAFRPPLNARGFKGPVSADHAEWRAILALRLPQHRDDLLPRKSRRLHCLLLVSRT